MNYFYWSLWRCFLRLLLIPGFPSKRNFKRRKKKLINLHTGSGVELKILISPIIVVSALVCWSFFLFLLIWLIISYLLLGFIVIPLFIYFFLSILTLCRCWLGICLTFPFEFYDTCILFTDPCHNSTWIHSLQI